MAVLAVILGAAYLWPLPAAPDASLAAPASAKLELPVEPVPIDVDDLRKELSQVVELLLEQYPDSAGSHRTAATLYQFLMQHDGAAEHWRKCVELDPADVEARVWLAKIQIKQGENEQAVETLTRAAERGFRSEELFQQLAVAQQRCGRLAEAEQTAKAGLGVHPGSSELWLTLGQVQLQLERLEDAKASYESALQRDSDSSAAHLGLANVCTQLGETERAAEHRRIVEDRKQAQRDKRRAYEEEYEETLRHTASTVLAGAASEYDARGESARAEQLCLRACEVDPVAPPPYRQLANMYHRQGQLEQALIVQRRLVHVEPANAVNYLNLANLAWQLRRTEEGEAALFEAERRFPEDPLVQRAVSLYRGSAAIPQ